MHRFLLAPLILIAPLGAMSACTIGSASGQTYLDGQRSTYTGFKRVEVSAGVETIVSQGPFDVKGEILEGSNFDQLMVEVRGDTLIISRKSNWFGTGPRYRVRVSAPTFVGLEASSGAEFTATNLTLQDVDVDVSSGASMNVSGACGSLNLDISSGAHFEGENLHCTNARVNASSGASADAFATQVANGDASSGASVTFHGQPAQFHEDSSSGGSVRTR